MKQDVETAELRSLGNKLFWTAVITLIVCVKLTITAVAPSLRAPGELPLSAFLLLVCTVQLFLLHSKLKRKSTQGEKESE